MFVQTSMLHAECGQLFWGETPPPADPCIECLGVPAVHRREEITRYREFALVPPEASELIAARSFKHLCNLALSDRDSQTVDSQTLTRKRPEVRSGRE
jgi:hypothetical protein